MIIITKNKPFRGHYDPGYSEPHFSKKPSETCLRSMKKALENLNLMVDKGGRRSRIDRRIFSYGVVLADRRSGKDRRSGLDRRISPQLKLNEDLERRQAFKF